MKDVIQWKYQGLDFTPYWNMETHEVSLRLRNNIDSSLSSERLEQLKRYICGRAQVELAVEKNTLVRTIQAELMATATKVHGVWVVEELREEYPMAQQLSMLRKTPYKLFFIHAINSLLDHWGELFTGASNTLDDVCDLRQQPLDILINTARQHLEQFSELARQVARERALTLAYCKQLAERVGTMVDKDQHYDFGEMNPKDFLYKVFIPARQAHDELVGEGSAGRSIYEFKEAMRLFDSSIACLVAPTAEARRDLPTRKKPKIAA
jgi:hypothetical protein